MKKKTILTIFICGLVCSGLFETYHLRADSNKATTRATLPAYTPRLDRDKPVIAVVGANSYTELTDYVIPYGVLSEANVARVFALGTEQGPLRMFPALHIEPQATVLEFDQKFPGGADYVFVPAVHNSDDPVLIDWVRAQSRKGATIIGVCDGVKVVANSGLLKNRKAVGHWYALDGLEDEFTDTQWVRDTRYLADENVITTTGVTASIPVSLALVAAIAGVERADAVARQLGVKDWGVSHQSHQFQLNATRLWTIASNWLSFWSKEKIGIPVESEFDEIVLALTADAYSRTYRSRAFIQAVSIAGIHSKRGLRFLPDVNQNADDAFDRIIELPEAVPVALSLDTALTNIQEFYGAATADIVALTMEYPKFLSPDN